MRRRFIGLYFSIFPPVAAGTALLSDRIHFIVPQFYYYSVNIFLLSGKFMIICLPFRFRRGLPLRLIYRFHADVLRVVAEPAPEDVEPAAMPCVLLVPDTQDKGLGVVKIRYRGTVFRLR